MTDPILDSVLMEHLGAKMIHIKNTCISDYGNAWGLFSLSRINLSHHHDRIVTRTS